MADPHPNLSVLVDPPLADPPPVAELERRARRFRRRALAGRGATAAVVAVALIAGARALVGGDEPHTVRTASPPPPTDSAQALPAPAAQAGPVLLYTTEVGGGGAWKLLGRPGPDGAVCFQLVSDAGDEITPECLALDGRLVAVATADLSTASLVYGIVAPDVTSVAFGDSNLEILGRGSGLPAHAFATIVSSIGENALIIARRGNQTEQVSVALPIHRRVSSINGIPVPADPDPTPPRLTVTPVHPRTEPPAPDAPVSTVPPPTTTPPATPPPPANQPKRVEPVQGATSLQKHAFDSWVPAGTQSIAVRFWNGVEPCSVLGRVDVGETADKVTVTLWTGIGPGAEKMACIQLAAYYEVLVPLSAPLGNRTVLDGAA